MAQRLSLSGAVLAFAVFLAACGSSHGRHARSEVDAGGLDAARRDAGARPLDAGTRADSGAVPSCAPEDARAASCPEALCDGIPTWHWNGDDCIPIDCGACIGEDCDNPVFTREQCLAEHLGCIPAQCRSTDGIWMWWAEECGHPVCGFPAPQDCEVGQPVCDCGWGRRFEEGVGCVATTCPEIDPQPPDVLCTATRGTWGAICCDSVCGVPCGDDCRAFACDCGPMRVFDAVRGCVDSVRCHERTEGESCDGVARCAQGTICCDTCGGAGCAGRPTCRLPTCDLDPDTDECGNDRRAP